jgi:SPW repeat-containing protein
MAMFRALLWEDWLGLLVGAWLIASPWVLGYSDEMTPKLLAIVPGAALMSAELANVEGHTSTEEWIDVLIGAGLVVAPFAFGFDSETVPTANSIASGLAAMLLAGWALSPLDDSIRHWWGRRATRL